MSIWNMYLMSYSHHSEYNTCSAPSQLEIAGCRTVPSAFR